VDNSVPTASDGLAAGLNLNPTDAVDLHLHTLASDGAWTPAALLDHLAAGNFRVAAVCDHDTQRSVPELMRRASKRGIHVIPGVEVTARWRDRQWHILIYGIRPDRADDAAAPFRFVLADLDARLQELAEDARRRLEGSNRPLHCLEEIVAGRPLWPFHVLSAAIREAHARDLKTAAELVTSLGGGFSADVELERVVAAAHEAGGLCLVAHPGRADAVGIMTEADLDAMLAEMPIDGLEAHYRSYSDEQTALYREMAERRGLLISCGSDSHAPGRPVEPRPWRASWCADLLGRLGVTVTPEADGEPVWAPGMDKQAVPAQTPPAGGQSESPGEQILDAETQTKAEAEREAVPAPG
jgi:predicted metal-dependent phosphoesterase TrpH